MEQTIHTRQNQELNIDRLCAQKQIYVIAKRIFMFQIILTVPVTIALALLKLFLAIAFKVDISAYVLLYGILVTVLDLVMITPLISETKKAGAKVQELFDCAVYDLGWNKIFVGKKPTQEAVTKNNRVFREDGGDVSKLVDWYPIELANRKPSEAVVLCQKTNLIYDSSLRKSFVNNVVLVAMGTLIILILFGLFQGYSLKDFLIQLCASFLPIFVLSTKIFIEQHKTLKSSEELRGSIDGLLDNVEGITVGDIRHVQDRIYSSRKDGALIPEFFYDRLRSRLEKEMHENAANY